MCVCVCVGVCVWVGVSPLSYVCVRVLAGWLTNNWVAPEQDKMEAGSMPRSGSLYTCICSLEGVGPPFVPHFGHHATAWQQLENTANIFISTGGAIKLAWGMRKKSYFFFRGLYSSDWDSFVHGHVRRCHHA